MFGKDGKQIATPKRILTPMEIKRVEKLISENCGYTKIYKITGISESKLKADKLFTNNEAVIKKNIEGKYISLTKKRVPKNSMVNPSVVEGIIDLTDITFKSLLKANKSARVLKWGNKKIKMAILATKDKGTFVKLWVVNSRVGEQKRFFEYMIFNHCLPLGLKSVGVDTNAKFGKSTIKFYHLVKDSKYPYNQSVEGKIGNIKSLLYRNIEKIKSLPIDKAKDYIRELIDIQLYNKVKILIEVIQ